MFIACFGCVFSRRASRWLLLISSTVHSPKVQCARASKAPRLMHCAVYAVVAAGTIIAFIIRDVGDAPLAGWIIQVRRGHDHLAATNH